MSLPITKKQAFKAARWMKNNYGSKIDLATRGKPYDTNVICAIACQETAYFWLSFIRKLSADEVLARCVLDASGDYPGTKRSAFPRNTKAFRKKFGKEKTNLLISEANLSRNLRGFKDKDWVYKGYGIFQYDLQYVKSDPVFFFEKQWYQFDSCLDKVIYELDYKYKIYKNLWKTIKAYNGSGRSATKYANNVTQYIKYCSEV
jgi:hypothetical protein